MTALIPERAVVDTAALSEDIAAVLAAHGITGADVSVRAIEQGGTTAGVTVSATAYERPSRLPAPPARDDAADLDELFHAITDRFESAAVPNLTVVKS